MKLPKFQTDGRDRSERAEAYSKKLLAGGRLRTLNEIFAGGGDEAKKRKEREAKEKEKQNEES